MMLKMFRAMWFLSMLVALANLLFVYAGLPDLVIVAENQQSGSVSLNREWLFYGMMTGLVLINAMVYLMKNLLPAAEDLRAWFHGLIITINVFMIISLHAVSVFNSGESFDFSRASLLLSGSIILILLWAAMWPLYLLYQKFFIKHAI